MLRLLQVWLAVLLFVVPLVFSKQTYDWFDHPKQLVLFPWIAVGCVLACLLMLTEQHRPRLSLDRGVILGLSVFAGIYLWSVLNSRSLLASLMGSQGRVQGSALALFGYIILFFIMYFSVRRMQSTKVLLYSLIGSSVLQSAIALCQRAGWHVLGIDTLGQGLGTLGMAAGLALLSTAGWLGAYLAGTQESDRTRKIIWFAISAFCVSGVLTAGYEFGWLFVLVALLYLLLVLPWPTLTSFDVLGLTSLVAAAVLGGLVLNTPWLGIGAWLTPGSLLEASAGWDAAANISRIYPWLGSGPETFSFIYPAFKPIVFNLGQNWGYSFAYPFSELFSLLANTGYLGVAAFLLFISASAKTLRLFGRERGQAGFSQMTLWSTVWLICVIYWFVAGNSTMASVLFWVSLALALGTMDRSSVPDRHGKLSDETQRQVENQMLLSAVAGVIAISVVGYYTVQWFRADLAFTRQLRLQTGIELTEEVTQELYDQATLSADLAPWNDRYLYSAAQAAIALADTKKTKDSTGGSVTMTEQAFVLYDEAKEYLREVTEIDPYLAAGWAGRAEAYLGSAESGQLPREAMAYYQKASELEPTNPQYYYALALLSAQSGAAAQVESYLRLSLSVKPDWVVPRYELSGYLEQAQRYAEAKQELVVIQEYLNNDSSDTTEAKQTIAEALTRIEGLLSASTEGTAP